MTVLKHKTPCKQCPFRRSSMKGWLGASDPEEFLFMTMHDVHMPCHSAVDYEDPDWMEKQLPDAAHCAGSLIMIRNQFKRPIDPVMVERVEAVVMDPDVFSWDQEFLDHHLRRGMSDEDES